jgi:hypothetical protein
VYRVQPSRCVIIYLQVAGGYFTRKSREKKIKEKKEKNIDR